MNRKVKFSDELLNQYLDGELDSDVENEIMEEALENPDLNLHLRELRQVRALIRQALGTESSAQTPSARYTNWRITGISVAASVFVALGVFIGWNLQGVDQNQQARTLIGPDRISTVPQLVANQQSDEVKAILHVSSAEAGSMQVALDEAEYLLRTYRENGRKLHLEILVNAGGLEHYRQDKTRFKVRLTSLKKDYPDLALLACNKTIQRLKMEKNEDAKLLNGVEVVPSALDRILYRLHSGWSYIKA